MATSTKQITANQQNAQKSTGPKSTDGKAVAAQNATRHGILSTRLFLQDDEPETFRQLFDELAVALKPAGTMELLMVEKIACAIWKQRRVIRAESAAIELGRQSRSLLQTINEALGTVYHDTLSERDVEPYDQELQKWCAMVANEYDKLMALDGDINLAVLKTKAPYIWGQLQDEADEDKETPETYVASLGKPLYEWLHDLKNWVDGELKKANKRPYYISLYQTAQAKKGVLGTVQQEALERYQASLDNQLFKAMKELRQLQEWRLKTQETVPVVDDPALQATG